VRNPSWKILGPTRWIFHLQHWSHWAYIKITSLLVPSICSAFLFNSYQTEERRYTKKLAVGDGGRAGACVRDVCCSPCCWIVQSTCRRQEEKRRTYVRPASPALAGLWRCKYYFVALNFDAIALSGLGSMKFTGWLWVYSCSPFDFGCYQRGNSTINNLYSRILRSGLTQNPKPWGFDRPAARASGS
jgi:hypothetical protein